MTVVEQRDGLMRIKSIWSPIGYPLHELFSLDADFRIRLDHADIWTLAQEPNE